MEVPGDISFSKITPETSHSATKCSNNIKAHQLENHMAGLKRTQLSVLSPKTLLKEPLLVLIIIIMRRKSSFERGAT